MYSRAEDCLKAVVLPDLERGRAGWDRPHTELVVAYTKEIVAAETGLELNEDILTIAAYGHDWGYAGLFDHTPANDLETIKAQKDEHMRRGANMMSRLLDRQSQFNYLSWREKYDICRLIFMHDRIEDLREPHELVLMEADTLASFDGAGTESAFTPEQKARFQAKAKERRVPNFITDFSRRKIQELATPAGLIKVTPGRSRAYAQQLEVSQQGRQSPRPWQRGRLNGYS